MTRRDNAFKRDFRLLTDKEKKVLNLIAEAKTNKEIAHDLRISPATVKRHLENILRKLQLRNRVEAAVYAVRKERDAWVKSKLIPHEMSLMGRLTHRH